MTKQNSTDKKKWNEKWLDAHPNCTLAEYSDALTKHTITSSVLSVLGTAAGFILILLIASLF